MYVCVRISHHLANPTTCINFLSNRNSFYRIHMLQISDMHVQMSARAFVSFVYLRAVNGDQVVQVHDMMKPTAPVDMMFSLQFDWRTWRKIIIQFITREQIITHNQLITSFDVTSTVGYKVWRKRHSIAFLQVQISDHCGTSYKWKNACISPLTADRLILSIRFAWMIFFLLVRHRCDIETLMIPTGVDSRNPNDPQASSSFPPLPLPLTPTYYTFWSARATRL